MNLNDFIATNDYPESVLIMIGKRKVHKKDELKLVEIGELIASKSKHLKFRSGNAKGADDLFIAGVKKFKPDKIELILPYKNHRRNVSQYSTCFNVEDYILNDVSSVIEYAKQNSDTRLIERYMNGDNNRHIQNVKYTLRNTLLILGGDKLQKATCCIYYDDLENSLKGGTGYTVKLCKKNEIDCLNQSKWMNWLT
jgi:hypothetical protein